MDDPNWALMAEQRKKRKRHLAPCMSCLRELTLHELYEYVYENDVVTEEQAMHACFTIARTITAIRGSNHIHVPKIRLIIHKLRKDYVNFRKFTKIPGVKFDSEYCYVEVNEIYANGHQAQETEKEKEWRDEGFHGYEMAHFIFRKKRFPMFEGEPQIYWVDPLVFSDSSEEEDE